MVAPKSDGGLEVQHDVVTDKSDSIDAPDLVRFCDIEDLQAASVEDGWDICYRQLQAGKLSAQIGEATCAGISALHERANRRLEICGATPADHVTIMLGPMQGLMLVNGERLDRNGLFVAGPEIETQWLVTEDTRALSIHIPCSLFPDGGSNLLNNTRHGRASDLAVINPNSASLTMARRAITSILQQSVPDRSQTQFAEDLAAHLHSIMTDHNECSEHDPKRIERWQTLRRAREYVDENISERIRIEDVCAFCSTSLSRLERVFRIEMNVTPTEYIRLSRLAAIQRELKNATPGDTQVARVAMDYGLNHLGRFSGAYRRQFGESPSETLKLSV
ncbi:MAG: helix-turn-helix transcriptional regulator [Gammaproteobacteria bacterium]